MSKKDSNQKQVKKVSEITKVDNRIKTDLSDLEPLNTASRKLRDLVNDNILKYKDMEDLTVNVFRKHPEYKTTVVRPFGRRPRNVPDKFIAHLELEFNIDFQTNSLRDIAAAMQPEYHAHKDTPTASRIESIFKRLDDLTKGHAKLSRELAASIRQNKQYQVQVREMNEKLDMLLNIANMSIQKVQGAPKEIDAPEPLISDAEIESND